MPNIWQASLRYPACGRKKSDIMRSSLVFNSSGQSETKCEENQAIMRRTGLRVLDLLWFLEPLSYVPTTKGRETTIVIDLEHIKAIITPQEVLLLNSTDPLVAPFIEDLQRQILCHYQATRPQEQHNSEAGGSEEAQEDAKQRILNQDGSKLLPFEFVALEACLEAVSISLEDESLRLELEAHPALDKLTSEFSTLSLEQILQIKSRLVAITERFQKVRDALKDLLDHKKDMAKMYLTEKLAQKLDDSSNQSAMRNKLVVKELASLLELYFAKIDGTLEKLSTLSVHVDCALEFSKIVELAEQNHVLLIKVILSIVTLAMSFVIGY